MSYPVAAADLGRALEEYAGSYLLTVSSDATTRAVSGRPRLVERRMVVEGRRDPGLFERR